MTASDFLDTFYEKNIGIDSSDLLEIYLEKKIKGERVNIYKRFSKIRKLIITAKLVNSALIIIDNKTITPETKTIFDDLLNRIKLID